MRVFQRGETIPVWVETKDWDGNYINPSDGVKITITDPNGSYAKDGAAADIKDKDMTWSSLGKYVYYYKSKSTDTTGWWSGHGVAQDGTAPDDKYTVVDGGFQLQ